MMRGVPDRKSRVQGKIANLPLEQQSQLRAWMNEGLTYKEIRKRALELFHVSIAVGSLYNYYWRHQREILSEAPIRAVTVASGEQVQHATLLLHIEIRPELMPSSAS